MTEPGTIRIGIAGWVFEPWRGSFYPKGLKSRDELAFASSALGTIEINATYYRTQKPDSFETWAAAAPDDFLFSVKGNRFITQGVNTRDPAVPLANFFASGIFRLGAKLGPLVWQLPSTTRFDPERLEAFLKLLPRSPEAAGALAVQHEDRLGENTATDPGGIGHLRHAIEVEHPSFADPGFVQLLRKYKTAMVINDTAGWPYRDVTADFVYARLKGPPGGGGYTEADLDHWAEQVAGWAEGLESGGESLLAPRAQTPSLDCFLYFVHEDKHHAPRNAQLLMRRLGIAASSAWPRA